MTKRKDARGDDCDVLVIGTGLGGSVTAVQLMEEGDRVRVSAVWRTVSDKHFAETAWDIKRFAWSSLGLTGMQRGYWLERLLEIAGRAVERIRAAG